ncbi:di-N-acetylchitobiase-like [Anneissia japonica]|uniref:di-N-acetylchitobiase-like n=1 Tax=Anneissia japonica TaxID=1529436 RepID=UPI0014255E6E|nr:di-N-acetylchitobiase-like [Anneissia japonica]
MTSQWMDGFWLKVNILLSLLSLIVCLSNCPCSESSFCNPIVSPPRKEIFVFQLGGTDWKSYDWSVVTTVAMFGKYDPQLMCYAHSKGARVVLKGYLSATQLKNKTITQQWISQQVQLAVDQFMDGINIDIEGPLDKSEAPLLTQLVADTTKAFHQAIPGSQVTTDVAWSPDCIDKRCYDYKGLAESCDFLFLMSYDEQSQIYGDCIAMANSPYNKTVSGVEKFLKLGISTDKLVLGVPWYGYDYPCIHLTEDHVCSIEKVPFRGAPCSDAAGKQIAYGAIRKMLSVNSTTGRLWNSTYAAPYFQYRSTSTGVTHQMWYDDPQSLKYRYNYASNVNLRGVGMWHGDCLDYSGDSTAEQQTKDMWDAIASFL